MTRIRRIHAGALGIALFFAAGIRDVPGAWAQSSAPNSSPIQLIPRTKAEREQKYESQHRISLIVQVNDGSGKPVAGLKAEDFSLFDNQKPETISTFREVDGKTFTAEVHVIVVLDGINDEGSAVERLEKELAKYLAAGTGPLPFPLSLVQLSSGGATQTAPSTSRALILPILKEFARHARDQNCNVGPMDGPGMRMFSSGMALPQNKPAKAVGGCGVNPFIQSIETLRSLLGAKQNVRERTILIWPGRGWRVGGVHPEEFAPAIAALNTDLREAQVTLDAISWDKFDLPPKFAEGIMSVTVLAPQTPDQAAAARLWLPALARQNGGQAIAKVKNFENVMAACIEDGKDFYVLSFNSIPSATADEFHAIEVKVDRPGVTVRAPNSYYAQP